jgi:NADH-quinone oxidoreductase subunit F
VPCRVGTVRQEEALRRLASGHGRPDERATLDELAQAMRDASICGLGQTAANAVISAVDHLGVFANGSAS